jgi:hypothetical protein
MDFSQYLQDYMRMKQLRGVTPGRREATALFAPYFDKQAYIEALQRKQALEEKELESKEKHWGESLAWDREKAANTLATKKQIAEGDMLSSRDIAMARIASNEAISRGDLDTRWKIAQANIAWDKQKAADLLAFDVWRNSLLMDSARRRDSNALWGNVISGLGALGSGLLLKKYWS